MMPFNILGMWFRGLVAVGILAAGVYFLREWYQRLPIRMRGRGAAQFLHERAVLASGACGHP